MKQSEEIEDWIRNRKLWHLNIQDVDKLKPGDVIDVAIFDRNMEEYGMWNEVPSGIPHKARELFRFNRHKIEYLGDREWKLIMKWGDFVHPIHYNVESLATTWNWLVPDEDDIIRVSDEFIKGGEKIPRNRGQFDIKVKDFHPLTRVGWRGPIMLWKYVETSKVKVFWKSIFE